MCWDIGGASGRRDVGGGPMAEAGLKLFSGTPGPAAMPWTIPGRSSFSLLKACAASKSRFLRVRLMTKKTMRTIATRAKRMPTTPPTTEPVPDAPVGVSAEGVADAEEEVRVEEYDTVVVGEMIALLTGGVGEVTTFCCVWKVKNKLFYGKLG